MKIKVISTSYIDIPISKPNVVNSDTVGDYKAELDCCLMNDSIRALWNGNIMEDLIIEAVEPYEEGVEEYGNILNNWQSEYENS